MSYLIYERLKEYRSADKNFHMPGHKGAEEFLKFFPLADFDITELSYSDNLFCPDGVISRAQRDVAEIVGAKHCFFLTDGSTSGVLSMLYAASRRGKKIIVPRVCHQSVWNGCKILGLEPVIVQGELLNGIMLPPDPKRIAELVEVDESIAGMIAVSPDYYGNISPLKEYARVLKDNNRLLLVDGAHGAHLAFEPERRGYAGGYADVWVDGAHKTLPTLTQGAALFLNNDDILPDLSEGLSIFRTTSPSYPVMASVEFGYKYIDSNRHLITTARQGAALLASGIHLPTYHNDDWAKLAVDFGCAGISADYAAAELEKRGVYAELSDGKYIIFYLSPLSRGFEQLKDKIEQVTRIKELANSYKGRDIAFCECNTGFLKAANAEKKEYIPLSRAAGRVCARSAGITPPCIPVALAGDIITESAVEILTKAKHTFGLSGGKIQAVLR